MASFVPASLHEPPAAAAASAEGSDEGTSVDPLHDDVGHRFGNFPNYYAFHAVGDRLDELAEPMLVQWVTEAAQTDGGGVFNVCDVGCNDGTLTQALHEKLARIALALAAAGGNVAAAVQVRTVGLELDPALVARAQARGGPAEGCAGVLEYVAVDCTDDARVAAAAAAFLGPYHRARFDLVTCWSTTMWVHVNHGDAAHAAFTQRLALLATRLVIEPQPWRCYRAAAARLRRQGRPGLQCYEDVSKRNEKLMEDLTIRLVCGANEEAASTKSGDTAEAGAFKCEELTDAAGSWKRKVLLFERRAQP